MRRAGALLRERVWSFLGTLSAQGHRPFGVHPSGCFRPRQPEGWTPNRLLAVYVELHINGSGGRRAQLRRLPLQQDGPSQTTLKLADPVQWFGGAHPATGQHHLAQPGLRPRWAGDMFGAHQCRIAIREAQIQPLQVRPDFRRPGPGPGQSRGADDAAPRRQGEQRPARGVGYLHGIGSERRGERTAMAPQRSQQARGFGSNRLPGAGEPVPGVERVKLKTVQVDGGSWTGLRAVRSGLGHGFFEPEPRRASLRPRRGRFNSPGTCRSEHFRRGCALFRQSRPPRVWLRTRGACRSATWVGCWAGAGGSGCRGRAFRRGLVPRLRPLAQAGSRPSFQARDWLRFSCGLTHFQANKKAQLFSPGSPEGR